MTKQSSPSSSSWWMSGLSVCLVAIMLNQVMDWHASSAMTTTTSRAALTPPSLVAPLRRLDEEETDDTTTDTDDEDDTDDAVERDKACRNYMWDFINGTVQAKDECEGIYMAWQEADCKDDGRVRPAPNPQADFEALLFAKEDDNDSHLTNKTVCCESITDYYQTHCTSTELHAFKLLGIMTVLVICGLTGYFIRMAGVGWIPDAGAYIVVGAIVGGLLRLVNAQVVKNNYFAFDNDLFLQVLLPPIIFEAALSIDKRAFRRDLFPILTFAILGTGVSALAIGYVTWYMSNASGGVALPFLDSLLFGALMSSIDPVATLGILSSVGVRQSDTLYTLVFGESLLNDGVSIVLFDSLLKHMGDPEQVQDASFQDVLGDFVRVTLGSVGVGVACGALCTLYFFAFQGQQKAVTEVGLFFAWALIPYYIADGFDLSGIISIMVMGFMLDYFVIGGFESDEQEWNEYVNVRQSTPARSLEPWEQVKVWLAKAFAGRGLLLAHSKEHVGFVAEVISSLMEITIFAYLGLFLFNERTWNFRLTFAGVISCVSSRAFMVVFFSALVNICVWMDLEGKLKRLFLTLTGRYRISLEDDDDAQKVYLDRKTQTILFSAGVRGAVSYALVQNIPGYNEFTGIGSHYKNELRAMTSATIVIILFSFGAMTYFTVQRGLRGPRAPGPSRERLLSDDDEALLGDSGQDEILFDQQQQQRANNTNPFTRGHFEPLSVEQPRGYEPVHAQPPSAGGPFEKQTSSGSTSFLGD